jgi:peptide/nickel transport system ATP-binding protein
MSVLEVRGLVVRFGTGRQSLTAVDAVSLSVGEAAVLGLVGESGSGKSSLAKAIVGLAPITAGQILLDGDPIRGVAGRTNRSMRARRRKVQLVFQDPYASLDPRMSVGDSIAEGVAANGRVGRKASRAEVGRLLELVRIDPGRAGLLPRQLSGGQRQRIAIARALAARPEILIADEITSALDVSVQGAALNLVRDIQRETGIGVLFISHNLAVVRYLADTIAVMHRGQVVESGSTDEVIDQPRHGYTRELLSAVPSIARPAGPGDQA